mgnify:CR=1 FL=1
MFCNYPILNVLVQIKLTIRTLWLYNLSYNNKNINILFVKEAIKVGVRGTPLFHLLYVTAG